jgi:hypothetical protein
MKHIIGHTGLVGKTLCETTNFDYKYNTKNINEFKKNVNDGDEIVLTCLPATKWLVNQNLKKDIENIYDIINLIKDNYYSKITLISTIDVYNDSPIGVNEDYSPNISTLSYGNNRYFFELMVKELVGYDDIKIYRLPALFNKHIKKNIIYDLLNDNNIGKINTNSKYQWYNLDNLQMDITTMSEFHPNEILFNLFPEPIPTKSIVNLFNIGEESPYWGDNEIIYNYKTKFNKDGYIMDQNKILNQIEKLINEISPK